jgi:hypothetical protein
MRRKWLQVQSSSSSSPASGSTRTCAGSRKARFMLSSMHAIKQRLEHEWTFSMPPSQDACVLSYVSALREKQQTIEVAVPRQVTVTGWQSSPTFRLV